MLNWSRWALLAFSTGFTVLLGCIGTKPSGRQPSTYNVWTEGKNANPNTACLGGSATGTNQYSGQLLGDYPSQGKPTSRLSSFGQSVSGAFKSAGHKVSNALEIKPRVTPANDPVKLASMPETLSPELYLRAAAFSESQGNLAAAQSQYEKSLELDPGNVGALVAYARFRDRLGDSERAIKMYERARAQEPDNAIIWNDLALCHSRRREFGQALAALRQAVSLQPMNQRYRNNLAAALVQANRPEDAVRELKSVYSEAIARHNVGYFLCRIHRYELAAKYLSQAYRMDPTLEAPQALLARLSPPQAARMTNERAVGEMSRFRNAAQLRRPSPAMENMRRLPPIQPHADTELRRTPPPWSGVQ